jgi:hypothetical protein
MKKMGFTIVFIALAMTLNVTKADCVFCQGDGVTISSGAQRNYQELSAFEISNICRMYETTHSLNLLRGALEVAGKTLDDYYAQYHRIDCHESRMTPIYRLVMNNGYMEQPELQVELEYFRQMDEAQRFEILNRVHVFHRRDGTERMRLTLLDQVYAFSRQHTSHDSPQRAGFEALKSALEQMGAKRYRDMNEADRQRAPIRSRTSASS